MKRERVDERSESDRKRSEAVEYVLMKTEDVINPVVNDGVSAPEPR